MRKHILLILLACLAMVAKAQPEKVKAKILTGIMGSQIDGDGLGGYHKPGLIGGMAMELRIAKRISLQPEIMYCQKGARSSSNSFIYSIVRLSYIDIAGICNIYVIPKLALQPGFSYGVLFKVKADAGSGFVDERKLFTASDKCLVFGVDYQFTPRTSVNLRHGYSLMSIRPDIHWYNNTLSFTLRFALGGSE